MKSTNDTLMNLVVSAIEDFSNSTDIEISPAKIARHCCEKIDPDNIAPVQKTLGFDFHIRQLAKQKLKSLHDPSIRASSMNDQQLDLFERTLQNRYPARRQGEDMYVLREHLTLDERKKICDRLDKEATAKSKHARTLRAETEQLKKQGYFDLTA